MEARTIIEELLFAADQALDQAWMRNGDISEALANARAVSEQVGREPLIEDAKVVIAHQMSCTPSAAFDLLVAISQAHNQKVDDIARGLVEDPAVQFPAANPMIWRLVAFAQDGQG
jgi:AmiR/NasT family two-component response regulator